MNKALNACLERARAYIDGLTVSSPLNVPQKVLDGGFFSWDNERRQPPEQPYLYQWSYYNGVVFEGAYDVFLACGDKRYLAYALSYLDGLTDGDGLIFRRAGYVDYHGADCYKTAALMCRFAGAPKFDRVLASLYADLTDRSRKNGDGRVIAEEFCDSTLGGNYWHNWRGGKPPRRYRLWLDGIYMLQPFLARYAALTGDNVQAEKISARLKWVAENMQSENGLYFHATNGGGDDCPYFWSRAIGWYAMALADVAEAFIGSALPAADGVVGACKGALKRLADGILPYQRESGMWLNLADMPETPLNRTETSGTAMFAYALLKGVRLGLLDKGYSDCALAAFCGICECKLKSGLIDIYFKASANGTNNYENAADYLTDEGKGAGPFIMAYSEALRLARHN